MFPSEVIVLFTACFRLEQMEDHFIASHLVSINRKIVGNGPLGRVNRVRLIGTLTGRFTLFQMLDPYAFMEAEIFPEHLKKWVKIPGCIMRVALAGAALLTLWFSFEWLCTTVSKPANDLKMLCIAILITCFVLGLLAVLVRVYISFFKLDELESLLNNSYFVARNRRMMGSSLYGRYCRLSHISTMLLLDDDFLSKSDPYAMDDIARFPLSLRRLVNIPNRMLAYSVVGFCVFFLCGNLFGIIG
jgi:hypothetical protein